MTLLIGTPAGLYRADPDAIDDAERVLEAAVTRIRSAGGVTLAATEGGLYRSTGDGWEHLDVYGREVVDALAAPDSDRIYAATAPLGVYYTAGDRWRRCDAVDDLPSRERWRKRSNRGDAQVRALAIHPAAPERVLAGIESGGVIASEDRGETWEERSLGVYDDVHHLLPVGPETFVAATGDGLYRTDDAGETWLRLDTDHRDFWYDYHRESAVHEGTLYAASLALGREDRRQRGALFEGDATADARSFRRRGHPGDHEAFVVSFAVHDGDLLAGTMRVRNGFERNQPARLLRRTDEGWTSLGTVPAAALSLAAV